MLVSSSWPGFVPAIHVFVARLQDVDARHKAGHDDVEVDGVNYGFKIDAPVVARLSRSICALAASFSA